MKKKAIIMALAFSAGVFVSTIPGEAAITDNGGNLNGTNLNGANLNGNKLNGQRLNCQRLNGQRLNGTSFNGSPSSTAGLDFTTISQQGLGK